MQGFRNLTRFAITFSGLLLAAPHVQAASQCKGLAQEACSADPACAWVNAYVRKDGREVKAYCRNAPAKKTGPQSSIPPASTSVGPQKG